MDITEIRDRLDESHITSAAAYAAAKMSPASPVRLDLTPGDHTRYPIIIVPGGQTWTRDGTELRTDAIVVLLHGKGRAYPWHPGTHITPDYAAEKWGDDNIWTGTVISMFLNELNGQLGYAR